MEDAQIQVYTGEGKGKTTASLGLAIRASGRDKKVITIYFDKGGDHYGERKILDELKNGKIDLLIGTHSLFQKTIKSFFYIYRGSSCTLYPRFSVIYYYSVYNHRTHHKIMFNQETCFP